MRTLRDVLRQCERLSILYLRCGKTKFDKLYLRILTTFNSLFEMQKATERELWWQLWRELSILYLRCGTKRVKKPNGRVYLSILYLRCC